MGEQQATAALEELAALINRVPQAQHHPATTQAGMEFNRGFLEGVRVILDAVRTSNGSASVIGEQLQAAAGAAAARLLQQEKEDLRARYEEARRLITPEMLAADIKQAEERSGLEESVPAEQALRELEEYARQRRLGNK
jgi:hypothetical protein